MVTSESFSTRRRRLRMVRSSCGGEASLRSGDMVTWTPIEGRRGGRQGLRPMKGNVAGRTQVPAATTMEAGSNFPSLVLSVSCRVPAFSVTLRVR